MKRSWIIATVAAIGAAPLAAADRTPVRDGDVTAISVLPSPGRAVVVVDVRGGVDVNDFTLTTPARLVVDVVGASLRAPGVVYDGRNRGGIVNIRYAQFRSDVVRIVLELDRMRDYHLEYVDDAIRITFSTDQTFMAWSSGQLPRNANALFVDETEPEPTRASTPPPALVQQSQQQRLTVTFDSAHISDVVATFSQFSNRSIILGEQVNFIVRGIEIRDQPWDVAFREILEANGLIGVEQQSGIILVQTPGQQAARDSLEPKRTIIHHVNFKPAGSIARVLQAMVQPRGGTVIADTATNRLIITDARHRIDEDTALVNQLDIPTAQVSIQAKLIFVDRSDIEELGVQYDLGNRNQFFNQLVQRPDPSSATPVDTDGDGVPDAVVATEFFPEDVNIIDLGGNSLSAIANADAQVVNPALQLIFSTAIGNFSLTSFVSALQQVELADLQAEPLITTADNTPASILVGERTPIRVIDAGAQQAAQGQEPVATIQFEETGIRLDVTPHITNSGQVLMQIHAENSQVAAAPVDIGFTFQTQEADNQILVNDGETAVIGGLTVTQVTVVKTGIPFLVDLPIVGRAFGFTRRQEDRRDLLILVTPHIIDSPVVQ
jgi:type IV pilus assembly protein PilQ